MKNNILGVIVGRYQSPVLHEGYTKLFDYALNRHNKILILVGVNPVIGTKREPLNYGIRSDMLWNYFRDHNLLERVSIYAIDDVDDADTWDSNLDKIIKKNLTSLYIKDAILYGGRDSFIPYYHGQFKTCKVPINVKTSSTELRSLMKNAGTLRGTEVEFREGIIYSTQNQYPRVIPTVDIAVTRKDGKGNILVLLGQKKGAKVWRFPGGFVSPSDKGLKDAAARELQEEAPSIDIGGCHSLQYVSSNLVEDFRYKGPDEKIMTTLFHAKYSFGNTQAGDDLERLDWFPLLSEKTVDKLYLPHHGLLVDLVHLITKENEIRARAEESAKTLLKEEVLLK